MSYAINSHVLTEQNPCIYKAINVLLIHGYKTLRVRFFSGPSQNLMSSHKMRTVARVILLRHCDVCVCPESGVIKTLPSNASIGAILHTMENELFETISTLILVRTLPYAIITIKHAFLIH